MYHLNLEELARLVDEAPKAEEARHLASCAACTAELEAMRLQTAELRALPDLAPPAGAWARLESSLAAEAAQPVRPWWGVPGGITRIAAGFLLFVVGGLTGTFVIAPLAAGSGGQQALAPATTPQEATAALSAAEAQYLRALASYAEVSGQGVGLDPLNRLAALEGIVLTTRAALREAPADPVINSYHLTALGQRDALLRQIERVASDEWF